MPVYLGESLPARLSHPFLIACEERTPVLKKLSTEQVAPGLIKSRGYKDKALAMATRSPGPRAEARGWRAHVRGRPRGDVPRFEEACFQRFTAGAGPAD